MISRTVNATTESNEELEFNRRLYDGWNLVAEFSRPTTGTWNLTQTLTWGLDLSQTRSGAGGVGGLLWITIRTNVTTPATQWICYDGNGNVVGLVDSASSSRTASYEYSPLGELVSAAGPLAAANLFRWSTKAQDSSTKLSYYWYRWLDASTGSWLSRDPSAESGGPNLHGFANNNPVGFIDTDGRGLLNILTKSSLDINLVDDGVLQEDGSIHHPPLRLYPEEPDAEIETYIRQLADKAEFRNFCGDFTETTYDLMKLTPIETISVAATGQSLDGESHGTSGRVLAAAMLAPGMVFKVIEIGAQGVKRARQIAIIEREIWRGKTRCKVTFKVLYEIHHIIPRSLAKHKLVRAAKDRLDIVTYPKNLVPLYGHNGGHVREYYDKVWDMMDEAAKMLDDIPDSDQKADLAAKLIDQVIDTIDALIRSGKLPLYRDKSVVPLN